MSDGYTHAVREGAEELYERASRADREEFLNDVVYSHPLIAGWLHIGVPKEYVDAFINQLYRERESEYSFLSLDFLGKRRELHREILDTLYLYTEFFAKVDALAEENSVEGYAKAFAKASREMGLLYEADGGFYSIMKPNRGMDCDKFSLLFTLYLRGKGYRADMLIFSLDTALGRVAHALTVVEEGGSWKGVDISNLIVSTVGKVKDGRVIKGDPSLLENKDFLSTFLPKQRSMENFQDFIVRLMAYEMAYFTSPSTAIGRDSLERMAERYLPEVRDLYTVNVEQDTIYRYQSREGKRVRKVYALAFGKTAAELMKKGYVA